MPSLYHDMVHRDMMAAGYIMPPRFTISDFMQLFYGLTQGIPAWT
jgi:hypothetical protein